MKRQSSDTIVHITSIVINDREFHKGKKYRVKYRQLLHDRVDDLILVGWTSGNMLEFASTTGSIYVTTNDVICPAGAEVPEAEQENKE